uniref:CCZ1 homolog, vacuolar protein trafficking and biogenesis associated n=1 Tax=Petromyzon marinus TaxID=7757 RepID=S4R7Y1_PETMA
QKILYYFPSEVNIDDKIRSVGLCEAIVQFTSTLSSVVTSPALYDERRLLCVECIVCVSICASLCVLVLVVNATIVCMHVCSIACLCVQLFKGTFETALAAGGVETLKRRLHEFFSRYLPTLRLAQCDLLDALGGITFFPLDKMTYLKVQSFVNRVEAALSAVS